MGTIRELTKKNGKISYHAEVRLKGYPPQRRCCRTDSQAKKWIQSTEAAMRDGRFRSQSAARKYTVADLIDRFVESCIPKHPRYYPKKVQQLQRWRAELGSLHLCDLSPAHLSQVRDKLLNELTTKKTLRSPSTVNRYLAAFSKALSIAVKEWGWLEENPAFKISKPKEAQGRDRYLSLEEKTRLLEACRASMNPHLYPIVSIALLTGMRYGEIVKLHWKDICLGMKHITLRETKNGDKRIIPLTDTVIEVLKAMSSFGSTAMELIFTSKKTTTTHPISIRKSFARALKVAGIHSFRFHDLRHTAASYLAMNGATQGELMAILGHRSPQMTRRYAHYSQQHLGELMHKMNTKITNKKDDIHD